MQYSVAKISKLMEFGLGFHSSISLLASKIFVSKNTKDVSYPKFLHLISKTVVIDDDLPKQVSAEGLEGRQILPEHFSLTKIFQQRAKCVRF